MDQSPLVEQGQVEAGQKFIEEFDKVFPVAVAFWLKDKEESSWKFHVASKKIGDAERPKAFEEIVRIARDLRSPWLGIMNIRLRKPDDRIVQFALNFQDRYPAHKATIFDVPSFEGVEVEGMYLYPPIQAAAA